MTLAAAELESGLRTANIPTLLMVLVQLTGDRTWLGERYRPTRPKGLGDDDTGGLPDDVQDEVRSAAAVALTAYLQAGRPVVAIPSAEELVDMMTFSVGEPVPDDYGRMMAKDLENQLDRVPLPALDVPAGFNAIIIGTGPCGVATAIKFLEAGIPFTLIERNEDVGGTWLANEYPGAAVDTPNDIYSFSFAPYQWSRYFAAGGELRNYLSHLADEYQLRAHAQFQTEATTAVWDEPAQSWHVTVRRRDGSTEVLTSRILISAVGALSKPIVPAIPGLQHFIGPSFHTARWPRGFDISGKRIGVIGTGASAMQLVPSVVDDAGHVTVFQRSPQWAAPFDKCRVEVPEDLQRVLFEVPLYRAWYRIRQGWIFNDKVYDSLTRDPEWTHPEQSINAANDGHRRFFTRYILDQIGGHDELTEKVLPTYPPFLKRMLLDNGWFKAMTRDDVTLETDGIHEVRADRVVMESGVEHQVDVLVMATGFDATHFLASLDLRGRTGTSLSEVWHGDDAKAYLGMTVPDFPNFFSLYGPNLQTGHGGSLMYIAECQLAYLMDLVVQMLDQDLTSVECRSEVNEAYNDAVDAQHDTMIWSHQGADTFYRNSRGRVVVNSPWRVVDFWKMTQHADLADYLVQCAPVPVT